MDAAQKGTSATTAETIWMVVPPIIFTIGVVGNIFTITVLQNHRNKKTSTSTYLTCLAISDLCHLVIVLPRWWIIYMFGYDIRHVHDATCTLHVFITFVSATWSSLFLVALTIERMLSTTTPHTVKLICIPRIANRVAVLIYLAVPLLTSHVLFGYRLYPRPMPNTIDSNVTGCDGAFGEACDTGNISEPTSQIPLDLSTASFETTTDSLLVISSVMADANITEELGTLMCTWSGNPNYAKLYKMIFEPVQYVMYGLVPEIVFVIATIVIVRKLTMGRRFRSKLAGASSAGNGDSERSDQSKGQRSGSRKSNSTSNSGGRVNQVTVTLLVVNITFIVCTTPVSTFLMISPAFVDNSKGMTDTQQTGWAVVNMLWFTNHAVNFILYVLIGEKFRNQALDLLCGWRRRRASRKGSQSQSNSRSTSTSTSLKTKPSIRCSPDDKF